MRPRSPSWHLSAAFVDNTVDSMMIFHQKGAWKIWTEKVLGVETSSGKD